MAVMYVIGEDAICCALGERLVADILRWKLPLPAINTHGVTKLIAALPRYVGLARQHPVLCIADTDGKCAVDLKNSWLPAHAPEEFILRLAVTEAESWLLADRVAAAEFLGVPVVKIPMHPDSLVDAKREVLNLARKSRKRLIKQEMISSFEPSKPGTGYNQHLRDYAAHHWNATRAAEQSPSLARAVRKLRAIAALRP